jgi:Domain of Unknown Function (DUF1080)
MDCQSEVLVTMSCRKLYASALLGMAALVLFCALGRSLFAAGGNRQLFNGKNLDGWAQVGPGSFVVVAGMLKSEGGMGMLWYTGQKFANVTIRVVFKMMKKDDDSGVFIRIPEKPTEPWMPVNRGYEIEIGECPEEYSCTGGIYTYSSVKKDELKPLGEWNTMDITLQGPRTMVVLNGVTVTDYKEGQAVPPRHGGGGEPAAGPRQDSGYIGLQNHHAGSDVYFKEVSVRPIEKP